MTVKLFELNFVVVFDVSVHFKTLLSMNYKQSEVHFLFALLWNLVFQFKLLITLRQEFKAVKFFT